MKHKFFLFLFIPLLFLAVYILSVMDLHFPDFAGAAVRPQASSYVQNQGGIEVYFCPHQDCAGALAGFLDSAQESIHCAFFEVDLPEVQAKLLEKKKEEGIEVQLVTDNQYLYEFNHPFVKSDAWGLMHNKFCIVDGRRISTGSMNPTRNCAHKNNNNLLLISSQTLADNYEAEFQEMWNGTFKKGNQVLNPSVKIGNTLVKNYFCPEDHCADRVKEELKKAEQSIYFMAFSFTHDGLANILLLKNLEGVEIRGVMEARQVSKYSKYEVLKYQIDGNEDGEENGENETGRENGTEGENIVKDKNKQNMHHKVFIIDGKTVITGSFNPSSGGDTRNDENILIIEDEEIARLFMEEFDRVWEEAVS